MMMHELERIYEGETLAHTRGDGSQRGDVSKPQNVHARNNSYRKTRHKTVGTSE
jgi:hypothetical protein